MVPNPTAAPAALDESLSGMTAKAGRAKKEPAIAMHHSGSRKFALMDLEFPYPSRGGGTGGDPS